MGVTVIFHWRGHFPLEGVCGICATVTFLPILVWFLGHSDILTTLGRKHICNIDVTYLQRDINATDSVYCILSIDSDIIATP